MRYSRFVAFSGLLLFLVGCTESLFSGGVVKVWGERGLSDGRFQKPRAMAIDAKGDIYVVDMTARIQVFDSEGVFKRSWRTPDSANGKPTGLSIDNDGNLLVADSHYYQILVYTPEGKLLSKKTLGGTKGDLPGQFDLVADVVQDSEGNYYTAEYGEVHRLQKFSSEGEPLFSWGQVGEKEGEFRRPQSLALDKNDHLWVVDACNHRIQVFDATGSEPKLLSIWGSYGFDDGQLNYPYDLVFGDKGESVYLVESGNHRVQKFSLDGKWKKSWGSRGRKEGQLFSPWALVRDSNGYFYVGDTLNHRVQKFYF
ncbi:MAG: hypothetical protein MPJ24_07490 [Pirellulaceae bacterium]|nr:hypothetical protein [Pirellulaceae bacterium]